MVSPENSSDERAWYLRRGFIIAAAVLVVIIIMGIVVIVIGPPSKGATASPTTPPGDSRATGNVSSPSQVPTTAPSATAPAAPGSTCGPTTVQLDGTVTTAPAAQWALVGTTYAPQSAAVGPGRTASDGVRECFARTPSGALFAAANMAAMGSSQQLREPWLSDLAVPGRGRAAALAQQAASSSSSGTATRYQIAAFRILSYEGTSARVDIAVTTSDNGTYVSFIFDLRWSDGQWKILLGDDGQFQTPAAAVANLAGYTPWHS